jgi:hypothetical protein
MTETKTYVGFLLPEPGRSPDSASDTGVLVVTTDLDNHGVRGMSNAVPLAHICAQSSQRGKEFRAKYGCHSPSGFSWGYNGSGPADLALCLLLHMGVPDQDAWHMHQMFKANVIAQLEQAKPWQLDHTEIATWLLKTAGYDLASMARKQADMASMRERLAGVADRPDGTGQ